MVKHSGKIITIILFGIIIIQTTAVPQFAVYGIIPSLAAAFLIALAAADKIKNIFRAALLAGLILDVLSGMPFGIITTGLILAIFTAKSLSFRFLKNPEILILALIAFSGTAAYNLTLFTLANIGDLSIISENATQIFLMIGLKVVFETALVLVFYKFALKLKG